MEVTATNQQKSPLHYHGDIVRRLFIAAGGIMVVTLPFFYELIHLPLYIPLAAIVILVFLAGLQNPNSRTIIVVNLLVSIIGCFVFEYVAVTLFLEINSFWFPFFWVNQALAAIFFIATYYGSKTVRSVAFKALSKK